MSVLGVWAHRIKCLWFLSGCDVGSQWALKGLLIGLYAGRAGIDDIYFYELIVLHICLKRAFIASEISYFLLQSIPGLSGS